MRRLALFLFSSVAFALHAQEQLPPPPRIFAPGDLTLTTDRGRCSASGVILGVPRALDSAGGHAITASRDDDLPLSDPFPAGATVITWTVTDAVGQTDWITQRVTVKESDAPRIEAPPDVEVTEDDEDGLGTRVDEGDPVLIDACSGSAVRIIGKRNDGHDIYLYGEHPRYPTGTTTVVWTATDSQGRESTATQYIVVKEVLPGIEARADVMANTGGGKCSAFVDIPMPLLSRRCPHCTIHSTRSDGKRRVDMAFPIGRTTITWSVTNASGATASAKQDVVVEDGEGPAISDLTTNPAKISSPNGRMVGVKLRYHAADACDGPVATSLSVMGYPAGESGDWEVRNRNYVDLLAVSGRVYTITVKAVDAAGNESTAAATVTVK